MATKGFRMKHRDINRVLAIAILVAAEVLYLLTMAPTFSFWDCGEFIATAFTLGIPHPPGAPLFLLLGRLFTMLPLPLDTGAKVNLISTIASAATVMLTYLVIVRLIVLYRKSDPDSWSMAERIAAYGGAVIGALSLCFSDSFWFNAVETEVYALSSLFTALVIWMMLRWYDEDPLPGSERWLLAVMYMIGLSIGVHLLSLLAFFCVAMIYYFKRYTVSLRSFAGLVAVSSGLFVLVYRGVIVGLPVLMEKMSWMGFLAVLAILVYGSWYAHRQRLVLLNTLSMSLLLLVIGYTSYTLIYVRAQAGPPINENNPSTPAAFFSYLNREQYGQMPLWPRRWSPEPVHQYFYGQYDSELDYFLRYQLDHMYLRYFGWQFIGRSSDQEGVPVDWSVLWGLPFLAGAAGAAAHFRKQWKMASVIAALFVLTGAALVVYLNQTEPQPRERDYSYVGSFFAFAVWIGIGFESLFGWFRERFRISGDRRELLLSAGIVAAGLLFVNARMLQANYRMHDRSGNFVSWDWAWNILQSCERNAILFTNGDNDTFPLWYLQEVARIRTDVRIVNLSLANTGWYLDQLKNTSPRGAKPLLFSLSDRELADISYVPVDSMMVAVAAGAEKRQLLFQAQAGGTVLPSEPVDSLRWMLVPAMNYQGQGYLRPQDIAVYDIVMNNYGKRPIYFALTVGPDNMIGLENFLRLDGLVYRLVPLKSDSPMSFVDPALLFSNLLERYRYRNLNRSDVTIEETSRKLCGNYKPVFVRLAIELASAPSASISVRREGRSVRLPQGRLAIDVLDRAEELLPLAAYPLNPQLAGSVAAIYAAAGEKQKADTYITYLENLSRQTDMQNDPSLFYTLSRAYRATGRVREAETIMATLKKQLPEIGKQLDSLKQ
jgi:hypothetical protein